MVFGKNEDIKSTLVLKNITVMGKRTSIRLEPEMWSELQNVAKREKCSIHDLCSLIAMRKNAKTSLTAGIRVFLMLYYRAAATENGHERAGHGNFDEMRRRAGLTKLPVASSEKKTRGESYIDKRLAAQLAVIQQQQAV